MKLYLSFVFGLFFLFLISPYSHANVLYVTNTNDGGAGSLRDQVLAASNGDSVVFAVSGQVNILSPLIFNKTVIIIGATAKHNTIHFQGGNFQLNSAFTVVFQKLRFIENVTGDFRFTSSNSGDFEFYDCLFENFTDENNDGAVFSVHGSGTTLMVENCGFFSNTAVYNGGVLELFNQAFAQFRNCTFFDNTAAFGGVFFPNTNTTLHLINNTFLNNSSVLYNATTDNTIVINNNIFSSSNPTTMLQGSSTWNDLGGNVYSSTSGILNTILLTLGINTSGDTYAGNQANIHLRASNVTDGYGLKWFPIVNSASVAIENGVSSAYTAIDVDGRRAPRFIDGDINGSVFIDAGACEYTPYRVTSNSGAGEFASIFSSANSNFSGPIYIEFDCSPSGVHSVSGLTTANPGKWVIDGFTQFGSAVPGPSASITAVTPGQYPNVISGSLTLIDFDVAGDGSSVAGLAFDNQFTTSIFIDNTNSINIFGNLFFSTNSDANIGVHVYGGNNHLIGGPFHYHRNVINGTIFSTGSAGLIIEQSVGTKVYGNFIGTSANGASAVQNNDGIVVGFMGSDAQIGGSELFQRNIISGNLSRGVAITVGAGNNNKIESNYIGLNYSGTASILNDIGILIEGNSNTIGNFSKQSGNVISGNNAGIVITGTLNGVYGNIMGLNPSGTIKIPNNNHGMEIFGSTNYIGNDYTNLNQRNIISGNVGRGILINGTSASSNLIYGNLIGPLADGINIPIGNQSNGIELVGGANNNDVGGATLDLGNVISGNALHGISIFNGSSFNTIRSNNIGIDKTESVAIPNGSVGIQLLTDCLDNSISNNMVAGNGTNGIEINSSNNNIILDNVIGCNRDVTAGFGNTESGITLFNSSGTSIEDNNIHSNGLFGIDMLGSNSTQIFTNFIGGNGSTTEPYVGSGNGNRGIYVDQSDSVQIGDGTLSRANFIKFNNGDGIAIEGGSSLVQHTCNLISNNTGLGIDIDADGVSVTPTDNEGAQAPVFAGAVDCSGTVTITGTLNGSPSTMYRLDFYKNINPDASGSGEGETYIEKTYVITDGAGVTNFNHIFSSSVFAGDIITAIASDSINGFPIRNSSEFAVNIIVQSPPSTTLISTTNETCAGTMDGAIDVSVSGGITPYTYTWLNSASSIVGSSEDVSGLGADNYYLEVEDATGCLTISSIYNIISPPAFTVSVSTTDASCAGGSDGTATSVEVGGTGPFTYLWSPGGQTTQTINGLIQGSYDVTVTDANGCVQMNSGFVFEPSPMMLTFTPTDPSCFGSSDGVLTVNVTSGGTAPFGYFWTPSSSTFQTVSGLSSGTYTCQVTDANGCIQSDNVSLTDPTQLILTQDAQTNVTCFGSNDGSATVGATGNAPFTYSWSPFGGTSASATSLTAQNYTVTVTDNNGCTAQENFNITEPVALNATVVPTNESCIGNFDGSAVVEINSGGSIPFVVQLYASGDLLVNTENSVNYSDPRTFTGLAPDNYYVVITDNSGCKDTLLFDIFQGQLLTANFSSPATGCVSSGINFTDLSTNSPTPTGWLWDFGDANTSTLQNPTHTYATAGSYIVTLTTFWGSCAETFNNAIIINSIPLLTNASSATICSNTSPSFAITSDISATYEWFATDNINVTGESLTSQFSNTITDNLVNTLNTPQNITYTAIPTSLSGCVGSSSTITITVNPLPVMTVPSSLTICSGDNVNLPLTSTVAANYNWSATSNILVSGESTFIQTTSLINDVIVNPTVVPEIVNYSVSGTSLTGTCSGPVFSVSVTINPTPATPVITTNSPLCVGSTLTLNTSLVAGASYAWSGPNGFTSAVQNPTISGITSAGAGVYNLIITQNGCTSSSASSTVVVDPAPTVAFAGSNMSICQNIGTLTMAANAPTVGVGSWSFISGPGTPIIVSTLSPNSIINGLSIPGSYIFQWSISNGVCTPSTSQVTITVNANPSMPTASNNGPICEGNNLLLSTPLVAGASYSWSGPNGFTSTVQNPVISIVTAAANGTYSVTTTVNGCASLNAGTTVATINAAPTTSIAGTDQTICINSPSATMAANFPINGTGAWSFVSGPATPTFSNVTDPTTTVNGLVNPGTYVFDWIISNVGCVPSSDQIIITIDNLPTTALLGVDTTACSTLNTTTLFGNAPTSGTGLWSQISGPTITFGSPTSNITSVSGLNTAGTYVFQWTISNGVCPTSSDQKVITLNPGPTLSDAGIDQNVCINVATATMAANTPIIGTGAWSFVSGPATPSFVNINSPTTNVNGLINPGTYIFDWVISSVGCTPSSDQVVVIVDNLPTAADAGLDTTACATLGTMTLFGNNPTIGTGSWIQLSGPVTTISAPNSNVTSVTGLNTAGTYIYQWTTSNGVCSISTDQKVVTLNPGPTVSNAGSNQTICVTNPTVSLAANTPTFGSGIWTQISGPNSATFSNTASSNTIVNDLTVAGSYIFEWTISSVGCTPSSSQVTINVDDAPTPANAGVDTLACETIGSMVLVGNTPIIGSGVWSQISGSSTTIASPSSSTTPVNGLNAAGTFIYEWTISNGVCTSSSDQKIVTLSTGPTVAIAGAGQSICIATASATMAANTPSNGTGTWSYVSGPTTPTIVTFSDPNTVINNLNAPGSYLFEWTISSAGCTPSISQVTINVDDVPTFSDAGLPQSICAGSDTITMNGNTPLVGTGSWMQVTGGVSIIDNPSSPTTIITGYVTPGTYVYDWVIGNGSCPNSSDQVTITVEEAPTTSNAGTNQDICVSAAATTLGANTPTVGIGSWSFVSGPSVPTFININSPTTSANGFMMPGVYVLEWAISNGSCAPSASQVTITVNDAPTASAAGSDQTICSTAGTVSMNANTPTIGTGSWSQVSGPTSTILNGNSPTTAINGLTTAGVYNFQWEITNGTCTPSTDVVTITVNEGPSVNATAPNNVCASESSFNVLGTQNNANSVMWSIVSGSGSLGSTTTNASVYTLGAADQGTTVILLFDGLSSSCPLASDTVYVVIDPIPNAPTTTDNLNQSICEGTTVNLSASTTTSGANIFWFSNAGLTNQIGVGTNVTLGPIVSNGNAYVISSLNGCVNNNPLIFNLNTITNSAEAGDSVAVCIGSTATLNGSASGNFYWINEVGLSDTTILNPTVNPTVETYYYLVSNNGGCTAIDSVLVYIITDCETIQVTNSFSPNGDGVNDFFTIDGLNNSVALRVTILNRWGDVVADIPNYDNIISRWDGTYNGSPVPEGTYFYIIEYLEGSAPSTGWVQVLR